MNTKLGRSKADIQAELAQARARLSDNLTELVGELHPKALAQKNIATAKSFAAKQYRRVKAQVVDLETNQVRTDRVAMAGAVLVGVTTAATVARSIVKRARKH